MTLRDLTPAETTRAQRLCVKTLSRTISADAIFSRGVLHGMELMSRRHARLLRKLNAILNP